MKRGERTVSYIVFIILIILVAYAIANYALLEEKIAEEIANYGAAGLFVLSGIIEFIPQPLAADVVYLSALLIGMNISLVIIATVLGSALGSWIAYEVGLKHGVNFVKEWIGEERFRKIKLGINSHGKWAVTVAALTPIPYFPIAIGAVGMNRKKFLFYGIIPRAIGYVIKILIIAEVF